MSFIAINIFSLPPPNAAIFFLSHSWQRRFHCVSPTPVLPCLYTSLSLSIHTKESFIVKNEKSYNIIASRNTPKVKWWQKNRLHGKKLRRKKVRTFPFASFYVCLNAVNFLPFMLKIFLMNDMKCKHSMPTLSLFYFFFSSEGAKNFPFSLSQRLNRFSLSVEEGICDKFQKCRRLFTLLACETINNCVHKFFLCIQTHTT